MARIQSVALLLCMFAGISAYAAHNPLLPRPQQMQYGTGTVRLTGLKIVFSSSPSAEDKFAASELSSTTLNSAREFIYQSAVSAIVRLKV